MTTTTPEIIDLVDDDTAELLEKVAATDAMIEPAPEPEAAATAELLDLIRKMEDDDDNATATDKEGAISGRVVLDAFSGTGVEAPTDEHEPHAEVTTTVLEEQILVAIEEDTPSWLETKLGPWVARHRSGLRTWLLALLAVYVSLFVSMLLHDGVRGLSERSATAAARDLLWAVLMGLIVLLAIGKHY